MTLIDLIEEAGNVKALSKDQLPLLASEIRDFLVENVSRTGGHLGPNLGVVELTIALHRVFDSPSDAIIFDTGHQSYVHKILTGRHDFAGLRQEHGLSGYPSRKESIHDIVENSHATTALSWADGIARAIQLDDKQRPSSHDDQRCVVAVIGDGAMTGGMAWEALNNIAEDPERPIVIVLNDNERSYAPTVGGVIRRFEPMKKLDSIRVNKDYEAFLKKTKRALREAGIPGRAAYGALHSLKKGIKDIFVDAGIFDTLQIKYIGPVDGHNFDELTDALSLAKGYRGPVVVHTITEKGRGYKPAEDDNADRFHAVGVIHPETGLPVEPARFGWTGVFAEEIAAIARDNPKIVGVTAAMLRPVGLGMFAKEFPERIVDVGIAEQHALTMAAGLAYGGYHPVVALYATFMNRAYDQLLMDIALHGEAVTVVLDRAGVTGDDGASHNGMWDLSLAAMIPGLRVAAPRDGATLRLLLREAVNIDGPTLVRYPKGSLPEDIPVVEKNEAGELLHRGEKSRIALVSVGAMARPCVDAARLASVPVDVYDPGWVLPVSDALVEALRAYDVVITAEDGIVDGGVGSEIARALAEVGYSGAVRCVGISRHFLSHASRTSILAREGMTPEGILSLIETYAR